MPNTKQVEKPITKRLERQIQAVVNSIFMEANCAGCGERHSIHDMDLNCDTGEFTCETCSRKQEAIGLIAENRIDAAISQLQRVSARSADATA